MEAFASLPCENHAKIVGGHLGHGRQGKAVLFGKARHILKQPDAPFGVACAQAGVKLEIAWHQRLPLAPVGAVKDQGRAGLKQPAWRLSSDPGSLTRG